MGRLGPGGHCQSSLGRLGISHARSFEADDRKEAIRELVLALLNLVPDLEFEPKRLYSGDDHIVFEYDMSGTFDGSRFSVMAWT
jgi:hypothetical protein